MLPRVTVRMIKSRRIEIADACIIHVDTGNAYKILGGTPEEKRPLR
jgi:hypothetical protein